MKNSTNPIRYLDEKIQKMYTKIGQTIPEDKLYWITTPLGFISGLAASFSIGNNFYPLLGFVNSLIVGGDFGVNLIGINAKGKNQKIEGESRTVSREDLAYDAVCKPFRLPSFLGALGFAAKSGIDAYNYFANGQPLHGTFAYDVTIALGLFGQASSMYLKDQDPRLLKKKPSKIKAMARLLKRKAKNAIAQIPPITIPDIFPNPSPVPVPVPVPVYPEGY